jgi:hypothetical protein
LFLNLYSNLTLVLKSQEIILKSLINPI